MCEERRIGILSKNPNPLFETWLELWLEAAERDNLKSKYALRKALSSLRKFPLPLATGRDCAILCGFGSSLCRLLDKKLELYRNGKLLDHKLITNYRTNVREVLKKCQREKSTALRRENLNYKSVFLNTPSTCCPVSEPEDQTGLKHEGSGIILLVDIHEITGNFKETIHKAKKFLKYENIKYEVRRLNVGDFCWIYRDNEQNEFILPYIIERKRMDDFASSIKDGRFHEQKFRLRGSGIQTLIYLIENYGNSQQSLSRNILMQAAINTQIHSKFQIKFTENHLDSVFYVCTLTKLLIKTYEQKLAVGIHASEQTDFEVKHALTKFEEFSMESTKSKQPCVKNIFIKQLLQLKSLSVDKATSIIKAYPTPHALISEYKKCTKEEGEMLLANIPCTKHSVGIYISKTLYHLYNSHFYNFMVS